MAQLPLKVEESTVSRPKEPEIEGSSDEEYPSDLEDHQPCIPLIFVMGVSGAGKSSFIKALGGKDSDMKPPVTSATESVTCEVEAYKAILDGQEMLLVDTPGFEDSESSNLETLRKICEYILQVTNNPALIIHGAIYVHNIDTARWVAGDERTWSILKALCGVAAMGNVIVATTRWPADHEDEDFENLEKRNLENHWGGILGTARLAKNNVQDPRTVIQMLFGVRPKPFQVQQELGSGKTPSDTSAGRIAMTEGEEALSKAEKEREDALAELGRISLQVKPVQAQIAPDLTQQPPPETNGPSTADFKKEIDALQKSLESAVQANKLRLGEVKSSEKTLQEEIQQAQALLKEKEDLLKKCHELRHKIESTDALEERLSAMHRPILFSIISSNDLLAMLVAGGMVMVKIGPTSFPFYGFAACSGLLLYTGATAMLAKGTPQNDSQASQANQASDMEDQVPAMNVEKGLGLDDRSDGDDERIKRRRARARTKVSKMKTTGVKG